MTPDLASPNWLPAMLDLGGTPAAIFDTLHEIFESDVVNGRLRFRRCPLHYERKMADGYPLGFWHIIERENYAVGRRELDMRRAERLSWFSAVVNNSREPEVLVWDYREGNGKINSYLWLKDWDYVIILQRQKRNKGDIFFLISAFYVSSDYKAEDLQTRYENREKQP